ncbi:MAG: RNA polymerase sigma factor [Gemmataceae bacterium]
MFRLMENDPPVDEAALIRRVAAREEPSFAELIRLHQAAIRWFLSRLIRDPTTVDDLAQEVFLRAFQQITAGQAIQCLRSWLLGVARNVARDHLRSLVRRQQHEQDSLLVQLTRWRMERLSATSPWETSAEEHEQTFAALQQCIDALPPKSRLLVEEHYFQGQSLESIARREQCKATAVRMTLLRIRAVLMKCLLPKISELD